MTTCTHCRHEAEFTDSVSDPTKRGVNLNECGYKRIPLCYGHAMEARQNSTSRVQKKCKFCLGEAEFTRAVFCPETRGVETCSYTRVQICSDCAVQARKDPTSKVETIDIGSWKPEGCDGGY